MLPAAADKPTMPAWLDRAIKMYDKEIRADGDMLSHDWIKFALDIRAPRTLADVEESQWVLLTRIDAFRDYLLVDRKVALQNVRGQGYRIVPPAEQARVAVEESMRLVKKGLEKGDKLMTNTRISALTPDEQKRHTDAHLRLCGINDLMRRGRKDVFLLFSPKST